MEQLVDTVEDIILARTIEETIQGTCKGISTVDGEEVLEHCLHGVLFVEVEGTGMAETKEQDT